MDAVCLLALRSLQEWETGRQQVAKGDADHHQGAPSPAALHGRERETQAEDDARAVSPPTLELLSLREATDVHAGERGHAASEAAAEEAAHLNGTRLSVRYSMHLLCRGAREQEVGAEAGQAAQLSTRTQAIHLEETSESTAEEADAEAEKSELLESGECEVVLGSQAIQPLVEELVLRRWHLLPPHAPGGDSSELKGASTAADEAEEAEEAVERRFVLDARFHGVRCKCELAIALLRVIRPSEGEAPPSEGAPPTGRSPPADESKNVTRQTLSELS